MERAHQMLKTCHATILFVTVALIGACSATTEHQQRGIPSVKDESYHRRREAAEQELRAKFQGEFDALFDEFVCVADCRLRGFVGLS